MVHFQYIYVTFMLFLQLLKLHSKYILLHICCTSQLQLSKLQLQYIHAGYCGT